MQLRDYLRALRRSWIAIAVLTVVGLAGGGAYTYLQTPLYESTAELFVSTQAATSVTDLSQGTSYTQQAVKSYADVATAPIVLDPVIEQLGLDTTADALGEKVTASAVTDSALLELSVVDESADQAAAIANALGEQLTVVVTQLTPLTDDQASPVKLTVIRKALAPATAISPKLTLDLAFGGLGGLALGLIFAILRELLDTRVRTAEDVKAVSARPVVGRIVHDPQARTNPLVVLAHPHGPSAEAFRTLRTNLQFLEFGRGARSIVISSSIESEGKTTTAANLAIATAEAGRSTIIIDADLRRPRLADTFGLEGAVGLTDVLIGEAELDDVLQPWGENGLMVLPAGRIPPNPSELLQGKGMVDLLTVLKRRFSTIVFDAPPLLPVSDAAILGRRTSGVLMVCAAGRVKRDELARSVSTLEQVDARVLGIVMTMVPSKGPDAVRYGYYGESNAPEPRSARDRGTVKAREA